MLSAANDMAPETRTGSGPVHMMREALKRFA